MALCSNGQPVEEAVKEVAAEAHSQLEKEHQDVEQSVSDIVEVQVVFFISVFILKPQCYVCLLVYSFVLFLGND